MQALKAKYRPETGTIISSTIHLKGDSFVTMESNAETGEVICISDRSRLPMLVQSGILMVREGKYYISSLSDGSDISQAACWGDIAKRGWCSCDTEPEAEDWKLYERYNEDGEYTGEHGFCCPKCYGVLQTG
ncbi:MAG: hypothetical protein GY906_28365 [bacterium]|nr:hypothetical protein [bacterium]